MGLAACALHLGLCCPLHFTGTLQCERYKRSKGHADTTMPQEPCVARPFRFLHEHGA
jgi:hypothetical protein